MPAARAVALVAPDQPGRVPADALGEVRRVAAGVVGVVVVVVGLLLQLGGVAGRHARHHPVGLVAVLITGDGGRPAQDLQSLPVGHPVRDQHRQDRIRVVLGGHHLQGEGVHRREVQGGLEVVAVLQVVLIGPVTQPGDSALGLQVVLQGLHHARAVVLVAGLQVRAVDRDRAAAVAVGVQAVADLTDPVTGAVIALHRAVGGLAGADLLHRVGVAGVEGVEPAAVVPGLGLQLAQAGEGPAHVARRHAAPVEVVIGTPVVLNRHRGSLVLPWEALRVLGDGPPEHTPGLGLVLQGGDVGALTALEAGIGR